VISGIRKALVVTLAWLSFILGGIGIFVPGLPTTIFWILAAFAFMHTNRRMYERIVAHPRFGKAIWHVVEEGRIGFRGKAVAIAAMAVSALLCLVTIPSPWVKVLTITVIAIGVVWVASLSPVVDGKPALPAGVAGGTIETIGGEPDPSVGSPIMTEGEGRALAGTDRG
jgi:uncharacterized membrane protein YbaN (DUF454 family)